MALTSSGQISLGDIGTEFNDSTPTSISEFYNPPAQVGGTIPTSGQISFSDFYSATNSFNTTFTTAFTTTFNTSRVTTYTTTFTTSRVTQFSPDSDPYTTFFATSRATSRTTFFATSRATSSTTSRTTSWR